MNEDTTIRQMKGEYSYLSNFWREADGLTLEHRFQAAKTDDPDEKARVLLAETPGKAKYAGKRVTLRPDWNEVRHQVMLQLVRAKFKDPTLRAMLEATGDRGIQEGNYWNDTYWGVSLKTGKGQNRLGKILMQVRAENRGDSGA